MKILSRISTFLVTLALIFSLVPAAYAGTNSDTDNATPDMLVQIISERLNIPGDMMTISELGIIPKDSYIWSSDGLIFCDVYSILLPLYDIYPYPSIYYPDILSRENHLTSNDGLEANIAAVLTGLAKPTAFTDINVMTKADLTELVNRLETGDYKPLEAPTELPADIADTDWNYRTFGFRNVQLIARDQIPDAWYDDFLAQGWQLASEIPAETLAKFNVPGLSAGAATVFADKTIYFQPFTDNYTSVAHEFVHYLVYRAGISNDRLAECYEEAKAAGINLREYAWTSPSEFFAVFMERWMTNPKEHTKLLESIPKTAALAQELAENYSNLIQK